MTCVQCCSEPGSPRLALHTPHLSPSHIRLQFSSDTQMEEWQTHLANVCSQVHNSSGISTYFDSAFVTIIKQNIYSRKTRRYKYLGCNKLR